MKRNEQIITFGQRFETKHNIVDTINSGHVPGSFMALVDAEKRIFYTSDFNTGKSRLLKGANIKKIKDVDVLITESTYASRDHPDRTKTEKAFIESIESTVANDGIALVPSFAIGRSTEILLILEHYKVKCPIYLDGMAKQAAQIALNYPELLKNPEALERILKRTKMVDNMKDRTEAAKRPAVIVSTSGMLTGGPIEFYIKQLFRREDCSLNFVGFQVPGTSGRYLLDTGRYVHKGVDLKMKMNINFFDFSAHTDRSGLFKFINKLSPQKVICMHGDQCDRFATELNSRGFDAIAPKNGDTVKI